MQVSCNQLNAHLEKTLSPLYLISGDEPLLIQDTRKQIIKTARTHGFSDKAVMHIDSGFRIEALFESIQNQHLFAEKKIIDIRNPNGKCDATLFALFQQYLSHPSTDRLLIISTEKLTPAQQKSSWFDYLKKHAVFIPVWPITIDALPSWIMQRARQSTITLSPETAKIIAHYCEGNLLAAQQAIEKLQIHYANTTITQEQVMTVLSDHARFNLFDLSIALRNADTQKIIRMLIQFQQTHAEPILVLWHIARFIRENITSNKNIYKMKKALQQAANVDVLIKSASDKAIWQALLALSLMCKP